MRLRLTSSATLDWDLPRSRAIARAGRFLSSPRSIAALSARIDAGTADAALYVERGRLHFRLNEWGAALNDFNRALALDTDNAEARQYVEMAREILEFRYKDLYNP